MTYNEERLAVAETQLELAKLGFAQLVKTTEVNETICDILEPYILAIKELKGSVEYLRKEVEKEKAKEE